MRHLIAFLALLSVYLALPGCITKGEYRASVQAWRSYYDATKDDLHSQYDVLPEPVRTNRLRLIRDEEALIQAQEVRAGLREEAAPVRS